MPHAPRRLALALALLVATSGAFAGDREDVRAGEAVRVVEQIQSIPESAIPDRLLDEAKAIVVVPDTIKAGFVFGGRRGLGLMSVKTADGSLSAHYENSILITEEGGPEILTAAPVRG